MEYVKNPPNGGEMEAAKVRVSIRRYFVCRCLGVVTDVRSVFQISRARLATATPLPLD